MSYQEHEIQFENLQKQILVLDSDEGVRVDNTNSKIFVNKTARKYTVLISKNNDDEFFYFYEPGQVLDFIKNNTDDKSRFFSY